MKIRAVVVDDEPLARELTRNLLQDFGAVRIVAECNEGVSAAETIEQLRPHLVFLDIRMAEIDGFDVLGRVRQAGWDPYVIFVTAYDAHAVRAFEFQADDFLLKPLHRERFRQSVQRACDAILGRAASHPRSCFATSLPLRIGRKISRIPVEEIVWIEAANQYACVHTLHGEAILSQSLASLSQKLDPRSFCRIHRSAIVHVTSIRELRAEPNGRRSVALVDGTRLPVSRRRRAALEACLENRSPSNSTAPKPFETPP